jgi:hypothetical protein
VQGVQDFGAVDRDDAQPAFVLDRAEAVVGHAVLRYEPSAARRRSRLAAGHTSREL